MSGFNAHEYIAGKMFVGGLSSRTTEDSLRKYFEEFGQIFDCVLMMDKQTGRSRGFGFVTMIDPSIADEIMEKRPHVIDHRQVDIKRAIPKGEENTENTSSRPPSTKPPPQPLFQPYQQGRTQNEMTLAQLTRRNEEAQRVFSNQKPMRRSEAQLPAASSPIHNPEVPNSAKIFVGGLTQDTNQRDLRKYFEQFGETVDTVVMYERANNRSRGFGFVTFASSTVAKYVLEWKKGHIINGRRVDCKKATPKEDGNSEPVRQTAYAPDSTINLYKADPSTSSSSDIYEQAARALVDNYLTRQPTREVPPTIASSNYSMHAAAPQQMPMQQRSLPSAVPLAQILGTSIFRQPEPGLQMASAATHLNHQSLQLGAQNMEARQTQLDQTRERMQPMIVQPERTDQPGVPYQMGGPQYFQNTQEDKRGQMQLGSVPGGQSISDSMTTQLIIQAYEKMLGKQDRNPYGYQKGVEEIKEQQRMGGVEVEYAEQDRRRGQEERIPQRVAAQNAPLDPKLLLAALVSKRDFKPFTPPVQQQQAVPKWGTFYDFSNPSENLQQMIIPDDSWGPMKETKNQNGEPMLNRAEDRVNKKPY